MLDDKNRVPAIERMDKIFFYLYEKNYATQVEISKKLNIPKATTNRILNILVKLRYLNFEDRHYTLGEKFYFLSTRREKFGLIKNIALPYLEELSLKYKETFKISVLDDNKIRTIVRVESSDMHKIQVDENTVFPLHAGAASKLLICQLSYKKLDKFLFKNLPRYTDTTIVNREKLKEELILVNSKKISFDNGEHSSDIKAVAVPILDKENKIIAAISCPQFSDSWILERSLAIAKDMEKCSKEIYKRIEYFLK